MSNFFKFFFIIIIIFCLFSVRHCFLSGSVYRPLLHNEVVMFFKLFLHYRSHFGSQIAIIANRLCPFLIYVKLLLHILVSVVVSRAAASFLCGYGT